MAPAHQSRVGTAGLLVMTAVMGAVLAFGWRDGDSTRAFRSVGRMLLESRGIAGAVPPPLATGVGLVHHGVIALLWGMLLVLLVRPFRGWLYAVAALLAAVGFTLLNLWVIPPVFGVGYAVVTSIGRAIPLALAVGFALLVTPWASGVPDHRPTSAPLA